VEIFQSFPGILLAILIIFVAGKPGYKAIIFALAITGWTGYARVIRNKTLTIVNNDYITAAKLLNLNRFRIIIFHLLPNIAGEVLVLMTFHVAGAILAEAALSFLGLGPQNGISWGALLEQGAILFIKSPIIGISGGAAIAITVLGVNFLGDYLNDYLNGTI
jgi:peptide/nickel transport system permease protein